MTRNYIEWRCRRSTLELDALLRPFFNEHYDDLSQSEKEAFYALIALEDADILKMICTNDTGSHPILSKVLQSR